MIPFAAGLAVGLAALVLLGSGGVGPAIIVVVAGFAVIFFADHFVRPKLIGGATQLPFLWVLLGILGGVELPAPRAFSRTCDHGRIDAALARADSGPHRRVAPKRESWCREDVKFG